MSAERSWRADQQAAGTVIPFDALDVEFMPASQRAVAGRLWTELDERIGHGGLTCSWDWTDVWLTHYGDRIDHWFALGRLHGEPVAAALITRSEFERRGPVRLRTVGIGTSGEDWRETVRVEYNRLLVAPHLRRGFARGLAAGLRRTVGRCDLLRLDGFAPEEIAPFQTTDLKLTFDRRICRVADLAAVRAEGVPVLDGLRRHTAAKIRRTARRLEERHGPITLDWAETTSGAREMLDQLRGLHRARWERAGQTGTFVSPRFNGFHDELIARLHPKGRILLARARAGDQLIGVDYGFIERNRVLSYQWGIAQFEDTRLSPGLLLGALAMQAALERGLDEYDWLAGDSLYKRELSTDSKELVWASAASGARMPLLDAAGAIRSRFAGGADE